MTSTGKTFFLPYFEGHDYVIVQFQRELWESPGWVGFEWTGSKGRKMKVTCDYFKLSIFSNKESLHEQIIA